MVSPDRRLVLLLPVAVALTVLSFMAATAVAEWRLRGVERDAARISANAVPAIDHLSRARTELRHLEVLLGDRLDGAVDADLRIAEATLDREWTAYVSYAPFAGETELWAEIVALREQLGQSVEQVQRRLQSHDVATADELLRGQTKPLVERLDAGLLRAVDFNGRRTAELSDAISARIASSRRLVFGLDVLSALLALVSGAILVRTTRSHLRSLASRMSELERFAGRVAHDIRSPLTSVGIALELAKSGNAGEERIHSMLERGTRTLQRVGQLIDGLLVFARAGAAPAESTHADVTPVLEGVMEDMTEAAEQKEIELRADRVDPCAAACTPGVLASLLSNLVGNAIKYMGSGPVRTVSVRVLDLGARIRVEVQDTGPGVPRELRPRIFDPYVRAADASSVAGLGLGLATVRRLAEAHGGAVGLQPERTGSRFWFELPRAQGSPATQR